MSEKTAEFFKDKTEEEIMNWMVQNMSPEQIKSCFDIDGPPVSGPVGPSEPVGPVGPGIVPTADPLETLRKFCANKKYVIHKIVKIDGEEVVYFWYFSGGRWNYYNRPFKHFKKDKDGNVLECGDDELVSPELLPGLKEQYNKMDDEDFRQVQQEYQKLGINKEWLSLLLTAINIQRTVVIPDMYKEIFNFAPVLIDGTTGNKIYFYYLVNDGGDLRFKYTNVPVEKFEQELKEVIDDLKFKILQPGQDRTEGSRRINEWVEAVKGLVNNIDSGDLKTIKQIYTEFPLSKDSPFFMKDLFQGNDFGKYVNQYNDLSNYVLNKFGPNTANSFYAKEFTNNFGFKTINLVPR